MISILYVIAAFGGGVFAAAIGGTPAFVFTGIFSIAGGAAAMAGATDASNVLLNYFAFGPFFGPHIAFAAGAAASGYAKKKGLMENGADCGYQTIGLNDPATLLVGGIFGVIGCLIKELVIANLFAGTISPRLVTDAPGITVFISGVLARLMFGGKLRTGTEFLSKGKELATVITAGVCFSIITGGFYVAAVNAGIPVEAFGGNYHVICFGIAAVGLTFAIMGQPFFGCHHILIISAEAVVQCYNTTGNLYLALIASIIFGTVAALLCDFETKWINSGTDSHIDGPAFAILIMTFVVNACFPVL